jgi:sugar phosphate isomerase/epimerase
VTLQLKIGVIMQIGISSPAFALKPFLDILDSVAVEFNHWEIVADLNQLLPDIAADFKQTTPSYDLKFSVHAPFNDLNLAALNPELRAIALDYVKKSIAMANELDIQLVSFHPGHLCPSGIYAQDKVHETNLRSIMEIAKYAEQFDIELALENMPVKYWTLGNTADDILEMIADTQVGICFDIGHAFIVNEVDNFLKNVSEFSNVHIHDNNGRRDEHLILGQGEIKIPEIFNKINNGYSGPLIIESNDLSEGVESKKYLTKLLSD